MLIMFTVIYINYVKYQGYIELSHKHWKTVNLLLVHKLLKNAKLPGDIGVRV